MHLLTTSGHYVPSRTRSWPLAGLDRPKKVGNGLAALELVPTATDARRWATYHRLYKENPWVYAAITATAWGLSRMPLKTFELKDDGQRERVRHDLPGKGGPAAQRLDRVLHKPSLGVGPRRMWRSTLKDFGTYGNAILIKERDANFQVVGLWRAPWRKITVLEGEEVPILGYEYRGTGVGRGKFFPPEDVIHFSLGDDEDGVIGQSPLASLKYTLALHEALYKHLVSFFGNSARPSANLKVEGNVDDRTLDFIQQQVRELYASPENAGKIIATTGDFQPITASPDHSQIIELARLSREEIAAAFHVPPPILGILDRAIMSNVRELREHYIRDLVGPYAAFIEDDLQAQLVDVEPEFTSLFVEFDLAEPLRPDLESRAKAYRDLRHVYTTNELRRMENLPDLDDPEADTVSVPAGQLFLGEGPLSEEDE